MQYSIKNAWETWVYYLSITLETLRVINKCPAEGERDCQKGLCNSHDPQRPKHLDFTLNKVLMSTKHRARKIKETYVKVWMPGPLDSWK